MIEFHAGTGPDSQAIGIALEEMYLDYTVAPQRAPMPVTVVGNARLPGLGNILLALAQSERARSGALFCVGFAAESHDLVAHAQAKRTRKGIPLLVGNIGPLTFGQDDNQLLLVDEHGVRELPRASKLVLSRALVAEIARRLST